MAGRPATIYQFPNQDESWKDDAACRGMNPDLFFSDRGDTNRDAYQACQFCRTECPVIAECLDYAIRNNITVGVWGGTGGRQRRTLRRQWLASQR